MFVERLTRKQKEKITLKILGDGCNASFNTFLGISPYLEIFVYDKDIGNYSIFLFDDCLMLEQGRSRYKEIEKIYIGEMYNIFGEEYKEYVIQEVKEIFN